MIPAYRPRFSHGTPRPSAAYLGNQRPSTPLEVLLTFYPTTLTRRRNNLQGAASHLLSSTTTWSVTSGGCFRRGAVAGILRLRQCASVERWLT